MKKEFLEQYAPILDQNVSLNDWQVGNYMLGFKRTVKSMFFGLVLSWIAIAAVFYAQFCA